MRMLHPNCTCGDCESLRADGSCPEMEEALAQEEFPRCTAGPLVGPSTSAESCKHFRASADSILSRMPGWDERVDRAYKNKVEAI